MPAAYAIALALYWLFELAIRKASYPQEPVSPFTPPWKSGEEWTLWISPGYWLARYFKSRIDSFPKYQVMHARRRFIAANNRHNLYASAAICVLGTVPDYRTGLPFVAELIGAFVTIRYISRAFEIGFAFGKDVIKKAINRSGLSKFTRIQLAYRSYLELFLISIPVYYFHGISSDRLHAIILSLSVGTLTNIGYAFSEGHTLIAVLIFAQVFSTLSLVLLSLASYISRERRPNPSLNRTHCSVPPFGL
jgi:hypothetical protein